MTDHLAVLEELAKKWEARSETSLPADRMLINLHLRELRETTAAIALMREQSEKPAFSFAVKTIGVPHNEGMQFIGVVYRPFECAELPSEGCRYAAHEIEQEPAE